MDRKKYNTFLKLSESICNDKELAADLLHDLLIDFDKWGVIDSKYNNNYIYVCLRNLYKRHMSNKINSNVDYSELVLESNKESSNVDYLEQVLESDYIDDEVYLDKELEKSIKLTCIDKVMNDLDYEHQMLFNLHFLHKVSILKITRELNGHYNTIYNKINRIKEKIRKEYENQTQEKDL